MVVAVAARCRRQARPGRRFTITLNHPSKCAPPHIIFLFPRNVSKRRLILAVELRRAELGPEADALAVPAHVPHQLSMTRSLVAQVRRSRARHVGYHSTTSRPCSTGFSD